MYLVWTEVVPPGNLRDNTPPMGYSAELLKVALIRKVNSKDVILTSPKTLLSIRKEETPWH